MAGLAVVEAIRTHARDLQPGKRPRSGSPTKGVASSFQLTHTEPIIAGSTKCFAMTFALSAM